MSEPVNPLPQPNPFGTTPNGQPQPDTSPMQTPPFPPVRQDASREAYQQQAQSNPNVQQPQPAYSTSPQSSQYEQQPYNAPQQPTSYAQQTYGTYSNTQQPYGYAPQQPSVSYPPMNQQVRPPLPNCSFGDAISRFFSGYTQFKGRASRSEFWFAYLFCTLVSLGLSWIPFVNSIWGLAILVPTIAISVRRLHDANMSGIWYAVYYGIGLAGLIPLLIGLFLFLMSISQQDMNLYGTVPYMVLMLVGGLIVLAAFILWIWMMTRPTDPNGVRFDN